VINQGLGRVKASGGKPSTAGNLVTSTEVLQPLVRGRQVTLVLTEDQQCSKWEAVREDWGDSGTWTEVVGGELTVPWWRKARWRSASRRVHLTSRQTSFSSAVKSPQRKRFRRRQG